MKEEFYAEDGTLGKSSIIQYEFPPLAQSLDLELSDGSVIRLHKGTYYIAMQTTELEDEGKKLRIFPRIVPEKGMGEFDLNPSLQGELENKIKELG